MSEIERLYEKLAKIKGADPISRARRSVIIARILQLQEAEE